MKVSYHKRFSKEGTCYSQAVSVNEIEFNALQNSYYSEVALKNPRRKEYVNGNDDNLYSFNKGIDFSNHSEIVYLTLSQMRFFNLFMNLNLKNRNTCILIRK